MSCKCFWSFEGLFEVSHLLLSPLDSPAMSHTEHTLSYWFEVSCRQVMLSVCLQGHVFTSSLTHTHSHFSKSLSTQPPSISRTSVELHYIVLALSDHVMLPRNMQSLRLPPRQSTLCNPEINSIDYHPEQQRSCSASHLNIWFSKANLSSLLLVNQRVWSGSEKLPACLPLLTKEIAHTWRTRTRFLSPHYPRNLRIFVSQSPCQSACWSSWKLCSFLRFSSII